MSKRLEYRLVGLIALWYTLLAISYSFAPLYEPPDEILHYQYIRYLADEHRLPDPYAVAYSQYGQPPLYYLLLAPFAALVPDHEIAAYQVGMWDNIFSGTTLDIPTSQNKNRWLHYRREQFPYDDHPPARAIHFLRLITVAIGLGTLLISYQIFRVLWEDRPAWHILALSVVAFWPLFQRMSGALNNDNLLYLLSTLALYLILLQGKFTPTWKRSALLGIVLGLAISTKTNGVFLAIPMGTALLLDRRFWRYVPLTLALTALFGSGFYIYNTLTHGIPIPSDLPQVTSFAARPDGKFSLDHALNTAPRIYLHFWASFDSIVLPKFIYRVFDGFMLLGITGCLMGLLKKHQVTAWGVFCASVVIAYLGSWLLSVFYLSGILSYGYQGRYLVTAIASFGIMLTFGGLSWLPQRWHRQAALSFSALLAFVAVFIVAGYYTMAFRVLPISKPIEHPLAIRYDNLVELIGIEPPMIKGQPGDIVPVELYWRAIQPATSDTLVIYIKTFTSERILDYHSYPATGNLLAVDWQPGETWRERHYIHIPADAPTQVAYPLHVGLYDLATGYTAVAYDVAGNTLFPLVGQVAINAAPQVKPAYAYRFGDMIGITTPEITYQDEQVIVCFDWVAIQETPLSYQSFIHVIQAGQILYQHDQEPKQGTYPTHAWQVNEVIPDCIVVHTPSLPSEGWSIQMGMYYLPTMERLQVFTSEGELLPIEGIEIKS